MGMYCGGSIKEGQLCKTGSLIRKNEKWSDFCIAIVRRLEDTTHSLFFMGTSFSINSSQGFGCPCKKIFSEFFLGCFPRKRATHTSVASGWRSTRVNNWEPKVTLCFLSWAGSDTNKHEVRVQNPFQSRAFGARRFTYWWNYGYLVKITSLFSACFSFDGSKLI